MRVVRSCILLTIVLQFPLAAQWKTIGNLDSYRVEKDRTLLITSGSSVLQISVLADDLVRVRFSPEGSLSPDSSWAVIKSEWPAVRPRIAESTSSVTVATGKMSIVVAKHPIRLTFLDPAGNLINTDDPARGMSWAGQEVRTWKAMPQDEFYFGFGEKAGPLERKGLAMTMWNSDIPGYGATTDPLYQSIPFFYALRHGRAYGIFFDNTFRSSFDIGKEARDAYSFGAEAGEMNYYFFSGPTPASILSRFTELVGRMPLPPRWSLGYQQCRWSYPSDRRVREIAAGFRSRNIPCDVIYLDIDYMDGYRIFTWNRSNFPDPQSMIADLRREGFRIAVIVDPGIKVDSSYNAFRSGLAGNHFVRSPDGRVYTGKVWPGVCAFPDFTSSGARRWWGENFAGLVAAGVRGWWNDMNEPSVFDVPTKTMELTVLHNDDGMLLSHAEAHNIYGMQMTRATYDGVTKLLPNERPFVLTRASYAGGQRYSAAWTGDNVASWEHLALAVPMCLNLSISGQPFVGTDIGGFIGYPSGELFARWLQLGVFTPLMRAHSVINEKNKEPWEYGDRYTDINRETITLRYRLLPYIYATMQEASVTGNPAMRPMFFEHPDDPRFLLEESEFEFGDNLLVAPVLEAGTTQRDVVFPEGSWYNYWTGEKITGHRSVTVDAPLDRIPFFVRAGAVLPTQQSVQYTDQAAIDPLTLLAYVRDSAGSTTSTYYEDDGKSFDYRKGDFFKREIVQTVTSRTINVTLSSCQGSYVPPDRSVIVRVIGAGRLPASVTLNASALPRAELSQSSAGWSYDTVQNVTTVKIRESRSALDVRLSF